MQINGAGALSLPPLPLLVGLATEWGAAATAAPVGLVSISDETRRNLKARMAAHRARMVIAEGARVMQRIEAMHNRLEHTGPPYACPDLDQGASDAHMVYPEEVPVAQMPTPKIPAPRLVLHPSWGYACICPLCEERFQNDRDMRISEKMYARHWRERHKAAPS